MHSEVLPKVLSDMMSDGLILCPSSGLPLQLNDHALASPSASWPIKNRAPDLYGQYGERPAPVFEDMEFAARVHAALGFSDDQREDVIAAVADTALIADNSAFTAEIAELADRLSISREDPQRACAAAFDNVGARVAIVRTHIPNDLSPNHTTTRSVRIRNEGASALSSLGDTPLNMSYHWLDSSGDVIIYEGCRSPLPVQLVPGAELTVICDVTAPPVPGDYLLQILPVIDGVRWMDEAAVTVPVRVGGEYSLPAQFGCSSVNYDYAEDHARGVQMVLKAVQGREATERLLEVGGGIHPQGHALTPHGCKVVSIDISSPMSQLGQLYFDHVAKNDDIAFVTCDANVPPFAAGSFDGVMIFSALHHFSDPVRLLGNLRKVLKEDGFVAVMCEPCFPNRHGQDYLRDLEKGINEQVWTVEEYLEIFRRSGLSVKTGSIDGGSLKAILELA